LVQAFGRILRRQQKTSSLGNNSSYVEMANNMSEALNQMVQNSLHPSEVANLFLRAVTSDNPDFRYIVGKDPAMSEGEFKT